MSEQDERNAQALAWSMEGRCPVDGNPAVAGAMVCIECQNHYRASKPRKAWNRFSAR